MKLPHISKSILVISGVVGAASLGACGGSSFPLGVVPADTGIGTDVVSIRVFPDSVTIDAIGQSVQLTATALDSAGQPVQDALIDWSSSDLTIVTVSGDGILTAQGEGRATVLAASGGVETQVPVTVGVAQPLGGTP